jgi:hypothetical protein
MKADLIKQFNLPPYIKDKTFAQASIAIENKFKDRKDKYSNDTKEELMQRLADAQEYVKMQDALQNESQQIPDQMEGQVPQGMEQFMQQGQGQEMMQPQQGEQIPPGMEEYMAQQGGQEMSPEMMQQGQQQMAYGGRVKQPDTNQHFVGALIPPLAASLLGSGAAAGGAAAAGAAGAGAGLASTLGAGAAGVVPTTIGAAAAPIAGGSVVSPALASANPLVAGAGQAPTMGKFGQAMKFMKGQNEQEQPQQQTQSTPVTPVPTQAGAVTVGDGTSDSLKGISKSLGDKSGMIGAGLDLANAAFGKVNLDRSGSTRYKAEDNVGLNALSKSAGAAAKGNFLKAGMLAATSLIGASRKNKEIEKVNHNYTLGQNAQYRQSDFAFGGDVNKFNKGGKPRPLQTALIGNKLGITPIQGSVVDPMLTKPAPEVNWAEPNKTIAGRALDFMGNNASRAAEFAPVVSNLLALKNLKRGATARGSRLDNVYQKQQFDEARALNQLGQQNIPRALTEASGGDAGTLRSSLLGADVNYKKALSNIMGDQAQRNIAENQFKYQADAQKDQTNVMLDQDFINRQAQDEGAYQSTKSKFQRQIADDIAGIGREAGNKDLVKEMFGYKWDGEYYVDKNGIKHSREEVNKKVAEKKAEKIKTTTTQNMFGGYTMKKR